VQKIATVYFENRDPFRARNILVNTCNFTNHSRTRVSGFPIITPGETRGKKAKATVRHVRMKIKARYVHGAPIAAHGYNVQVRARSLEVRSALSYGTLFIPFVFPGFTRSYDGAPADAG